MQNLGAPLQLFCDPLVYINRVPTNCSDADAQRARKLTLCNQFVEMCALEAAAGLNVRSAQDAALRLIALSRHMNLRGDMPWERVCCVPLRASDKESGNAFIALFTARLGQMSQQPDAANLMPCLRSRPFDFR
jgi:hypothetical protein